MTNRVRTHPLVSHRRLLLGGSSCMSFVNRSALTPLPSPEFGTDLALEERWASKFRISRGNLWWKGRDSNPRPRHYECRALTS